MKISPEDLELIEKIKLYRHNQQKMEILGFKNEVLEKQNNELKNAMKKLQTEFIEQVKLMEDIKELQEENRILRLKLEKSKEKYDFLITTPHSTLSVYGEIKHHLSQAKKEVLVCSPWITYLLDEFKDMDKSVNVKVITNFRAEDIKSGITDLDKIRVLKDLGADLRYNNNLHAKMVLIDSEVAVISSANMTGRGLRINYEAGVMVKDKKQLKKALEFFNGVWGESEPLTPEIIKKYAE